MTFFLFALNILCAQQNSFAQGAWNPSDWIPVRSARYSNIGKWFQYPDHLANRVPQDATINKLNGRRAAETYASLLWHKPASGNFTFSSTMELTDQMVLLLVTASPLGKDAACHPEFREHWEIVLWNCGINVWHHKHKDEKPDCHLAAALCMPYLPNQKYTLEVSVKRTQYGAEMTIKCGNGTLIYTEHELPQTLYAGITACEGINKFYDFTLESR